MDSISVSPESLAKIEGVAPGFILEKLFFYQKKTWQVLEEIRAEFREGVSEPEARKISLKVFSDHGVTKHWHQPWIRLGGSTISNFNHPMDLNVRLQMNDPYYLDLGPVWKDEDTQIEYEGDVGNTFVFGENAEAEKVIQGARDLFRDAKDQWISSRLSGEALYHWLKKETLRRGFELSENVEGHRTGTFPHQKFSKERLAGVQGCPSPALWVLEVMIVNSSKSYGAFFEDILN